MNRRTNQRPIRHFVGKSAINDEETDSSSEENEDNSDIEVGNSTGRLKLDLKSIKVEENESEIAQNNEQTGVEKRQNIDNGSEIIKKSTFQDRKSAEISSNDDTDDSDEEETSDQDSENESDSSEDQIVLSRPKFIPKNKRCAHVALTETENKPTNRSSAVKSTGSSLSNANNSTKSSITNNGNSNDSTVSNSKKKQTLEMIEQVIKQEQKQRFLQRTSNTSLADEEVLAIDDTDGLDPEKEYEDWKIREKARMKRDRQLIIEEERRQEEAEELRTMTEEEKQKLHDERQKQSNINDNSQTKSSYYHRGAFYQDDELVASRDFNQAIEDDYKNKEAIPTSLLKMNKIGKKGQFRNNSKPSNHQQSNSKPQYG